MKNDQSTISRFMKLYRSDLFSTIILVATLILYGPDFVRHYQTASSVPEKVMILAMLLFTIPKIIYLAFRLRTSNFRPLKIITIAVNTAITYVSIIILILIPFLIYVPKLLPATANLSLIVLSIAGLLALVFASGVILLKEKLGKRFSLRKMDFMSLGGMGFWQWLADDFKILTVVFSTVSLIARSMVQGDQYEEMFQIPLTFFALGELIEVLSRVWYEPLHQDAQEIEP